MSWEGGIVREGVAMSGKGGNINEGVTMSDEVWQCLGKVFFNERQPF